MDFPPPRRPKTPTPRRFSVEAEDLVARLLHQQGWEILARNFRHVGCELDIVARKGGTVAAIEVKARHGQIYPEALLPQRKRAALERGLLKYVSLRALSYQTLRLDLAIVKPHAIDYVVNI